MTKPNGRGLKRAKKKLVRLASRGARGRIMRRLSARVMRLQAAYDKRVQDIRAEREAQRQAEAGATDA